LTIDDVARTRARRSFNPVRRADGIVASPELAASDELQRDMSSCMRQFG
jgi:hypothetical protein